MKILILGNSGSGKTTMAKALSLEHQLTLLDLDTVVFEQHKIAVARPKDEILHDLDQFTQQHQAWVIEGSYGDLIDYLAPKATELRFLNPGIERCLQHHRQRPWEPHKYENPIEQEKKREYLEAWVKQYDSREDIYGLQYHRNVFERFSGTKKEYLSSDFF